MPTLTIDNHEITVPEGTSVLEAASKLGIVIPHFCYHEALGAVGACRLCAMTFTEGPVEGVQMSCMIEAQDGMVVSSLDPQARELREHVIEWLMANHPHDCPVCDEGGECQLQDMTIAGGHGIRRYRGKKRTHRNQDLGPFIEQEMNRCIQCYRCVRTYQDYCGGDDFGVLGSRNRIFFGRFRDGRLQSPFSGNIVDVCPTGVFTDKTFRFKTRYWDLQEAQSICPHCSLGCATIPGGRYRELQRVRSGVNPGTNGFFICDRGRFGYDHVNHPERPRLARVDDAETGWDEALRATRDRITDLSRRYGPDSIAFVAGGRSSLEALWRMRQWAGALGSTAVCGATIGRRGQTERTLAARLGHRACSLEDVRGSDYIVFVGADPFAEGPVAALAARQAVRCGAGAAVLDPRPVELPFTATHLPLKPQQLPQALDALARSDFSAFDRSQAQILEGVAGRLKKAQRPVLIAGGDLLGHGGVQRLMALADAIDGSDRTVGVMTLVAAPNSIGAGLLTAEGPDFAQILQRVEQKSVRALVCLEADPLGDAGHPEHVRAVLSELDTLVVVDSLATASVEEADIFLPSTAVAESSGTFINNEGRMLPFEKVIDPGIPISVTGGGDHPPRIFQSSTPGSQPRPAWAILDALAGENSSLEAVRAALEASDSRFAGLCTLPSEGRRIELTAEEREMSTEEATPIDGLCLVATETAIGSEALSSLSRPLDALAEAPSATLHPRDAEQLGVGEAERVLLIAEGVEAEIVVRLCPTMARGIVVVPRLQGSALMRLVPGLPVSCRLSRGGEA